MKTQLTQATAFLKELRLIYGEERAGEIIQENGLIPILTGKNPLLNHQDAVSKIRGRVIKACRKEGGTISMRNLCRRTKMKRDDLDQIISAMGDDGLIQTWEAAPEKGGPPTIWIKAM